MPMIVNTIGFSGKSAEEFFSLLLTNNVERLIDIRLSNRSQLAGFTNAKHLPYFLTLHDMAYLYKPEYAPTKALLSQYKNKQADWNMYEQVYLDIIEKRRILRDIQWPLFDNAVLLCSEATPENCHRRLLAEYLSNENKQLKVRHL